MRVEEYDATEEKRILTGMVVDNTVCGRIAGRWRPGGLFRTRWANLVGVWCVDYYRRYNTAPRNDIEGLFETWAGGATDEATVGLVDRFLGTLSEEYEEAAGEVNPEYLIDMAGTYFNTVRLEQTAETIRGHITRGEAGKAEAAVTKWNRVELGVGAGIDVLQDRDAVREVFEENTQPLITYPGDLGAFIGDQFGRDEFVGLMGATGRGKTWWLLDIAWMGVRQGRRVAFFEVGDMSRGQIMRRFMCRAAGWPLKPPYTFPVPVDINYEEGAVTAEANTREKTYDGPLNFQRAWAACEKRTRRYKKPRLRLSVHPNSSINVEGVVGILDEWERDGWVPDVVVIDYADILAIPTGYTPGDRDAINETWKQLRNLSQTRHILVATATQGDTGSYEAHTIRRGNFSDDRRKNDHVTGMLGLNAIEEEQEKSIFRLNWVKRREEAYTESRCVHVVGCLHIGRPHMFSTF